MLPSFTFCLFQAIGILSRHPFIYGMFGWLEDIWSSMFLESSRTSEKIETIIYNLLFKTTLPGPGAYVVFPGTFRNHYGYLPGNIHMRESSMFYSQKHHMSCVFLRILPLCTSLPLSYIMDVQFSWRVCLQS